MQVKTFIYGTPLGFNFYEDDSQYKDYFKDFYISSREGRRLMVNRLDNGETSYNFLCYRIAESGNRPNAFFGMSLVLGDYVYCADFGKLYSWFNFLFDKLVNERNLFTKTENNGLRYRVAKFVEDAEDVEWLKSNIPNILSSSGMQLSRYDNSFSERKTGKIVLVNPDDKQDTILNALRQSRWICLTPFVVKESDCPELDYGELSSYLDSVTKQLLPVAINPEEKHVPLLKKIYAESKENYQSISDFLEKTRDEEGKKRFTELSRRYYEIWAQQLPMIAKKINEKSKDEGSGESKEGSGESKEGSKAEHKGGSNGETKESPTRVCSKCGIEKPLSAFNGEDTICKQCRSIKPPVPFPKKYVYIGICLLVVIAIVVGVIIANGGSGKNSMSETEKEKIVSKGKYDKSVYDGYVSSKQFNEAYNYLLSVEKGDDHMRSLKTDFEEYLSTIDSEGAMVEILIDCDSLCQKVGVEIDMWIDAARKIERDFAAIESYLAKSQLQEAEKNACQKLINKYTSDNRFKSKAGKWQTRLNKKVSVPTLSTFVYKVNDIDQTPKDITTNKNVGFVMKENNHADIFTFTQKPKCTQGEQQNVIIGDHSNEKPPYWRIVISNRGTYVFNCGNDIVVTITVSPAIVRQ